MEEPQFIKCESGWLTDVGETSAFVPGLPFPAADDRLAAVKVEPHPVSASENVQEACTSNIKQEYEIECSTDIKNEVFIDEHVVQQLVPGVKEENVENAVELTRAPVESSQVVRQSVSYTDEMPYRCSLCSSISTDGSLETHMLTAHSAVQPFICSICGSSFVLLSDLQQHDKSHTANLSYSCPFCRKTFKFLSRLILHKRLCGSRTFSCSTCGKAFRRSLHLRYHRRIHDHIRCHVCSTCGKGFRKSSLLIQHQKRHDAKSRFSCLICKVPFESLTYLMEHEKTHTGGFSCSFCGKSFITSRRLMAHKRKHVKNSVLVSDLQGCF